MEGAPAAHGSGLEETDAGGEHLVQVHAVNEAIHLRYRGGVALDKPTLITNFNVNSRSIKIIWYRFVLSVPLGHTLSFNCQSNCMVIQTGRSEASCGVRPGAGQQKCL